MKCLKSWTVQVFKFKYKQKFSIEFVFIYLWRSFTETLLVVITNKLTNHSPHLNGGKSSIVDRDRLYIPLVGWSYQVVQTPISDVLQGSLEADQGKPVSVVRTVLGESEVLHVAQVC